MNRRDNGVRLSCQEGEEVVFRLALFDLANRFPARPDPSKESERSAFIEREPDVSAFCLVELAERRERDSPAALDGEPTAPAL
jgi:hypothetical protein